MARGNTGLAPRNGRRTGGRRVADRRVGRPEGHRERNDGADCVPDAAPKPRSSRREGVFTSLCRVADARARRLVRHQATQGTKRREATAGRLGSTRWVVAVPRARSASSPVAEHHNPLCRLCRPTLEAVAHDDGRALFGVAFGFVALRHGDGNADLRWARRRAELVLVGDRLGLVAVASRPDVAARPGTDGDRRPEESSFGARARSLQRLNHHSNGGAPCRSERARRASLCTPGSNNPVGSEYLGAAFRRIRHTILAMRAFYPQS